MNKEIFQLAWWKWLAIILTLLSLIIGLGAPLGPGIRWVNPINAEAGKNLELEVRTVNAHFKSKGLGLKSALNLDNAPLISSDSVKVLGENDLLFHYYIPPSFNPVKGNIHLLDLEIASDYDGLIVLRQGLEIRRTENLLADTLHRAIPKNQHFQITRLTSEWFSFPNREILYESVRNLFFHVAMWPAMLLLFLVSVIYSIRYLRSGNPIHDFIAVESVQTGLLFATIGIITGSIWAKYTWGDWWPNDPKLNGAAIGILLYFAYMILRNSIAEEQQRGRISAVYNVFAFPLMFVVIMILPRLTDSLHPGNGGNPGFNTYDLDSHLRIAFYPACLGWVLIGVWIKEMRVRIRKLEFSQ